MTYKNVKKYCLDSTYILSSMKKQPYILSSQTYYIESVPRTDIYTMEFIDKW